MWRTLQRQGVPIADLDDALQEVFLVAHRKRNVFDPARAKVTTWLFGICAKVAWSLRRRRRERHFGELPELADHDTPEATCARNQRMMRLSAALDTLSPEHRATFLMFEVEGVACSQIAELCGVPVGTVYSRLHGARAILRRALEEDSCCGPDAPHAPSGSSPVAVEGALECPRIPPARITPGELP